MSDSEDSTVTLQHTPGEEQPLPVAASPTADSPGYVPESDPEEEPEADDDEDLEEDPADYPLDQDDDEEEEEPSGDERLVRHGGRGRGEGGESTRFGRLYPHGLLDQFKAEKPSTFIHYHYYSFTPLQLYPSDRRATRPENYNTTSERLGMIWLSEIWVGRELACCAVDRLEVIGQTMGFVDTMDAKISRRRAEEVGYGIRDAWVDPRDAAEERLEDTQGRQTQIYQRVETLADDSQYHYETARLLDQEALVSREACGRSMEVSYMARSEIMTLRSIVMSQTTEGHKGVTEIAALRTFDRTRQEQLVQTLTLMQSL
ncbi:hypothetical protein Tco_1039851 [Tanacetum coccineum]